MSAEDIIKNSEFGDNAIIEEQDKIVEALVVSWNHILIDFESKTIAFATRVIKLLKDVPDKTYSEVIDKVRNHPKLMDSSMSKRRIMMGVRFVRERPDVIEYDKLPIEEKKLVQDKPVVLSNLRPNYELYFNLYKYSIDPAFKKEIEEKAKAQGWSSRKVEFEASKFLEEKRTPNTQRRHKKYLLIKEISVMLKDLSVDELEPIGRHIIQQYLDKMPNYAKYLAVKQKERKENEMKGE